MLFNYFKIAIRSLLKNPTFSFINIAGLSIGLASSILILLWVWDEVTFNHYFPNHDNIYQVKLNAVVDKGILTGQSMPYPLKEAILLQDSRIKRAAMTNWGEGALMSVGEKKLNKVGLWVSESFLDIFQFQLIQGNNQALNDPKSIVLAQYTATALFGNEDPMGKMILIENRDELKVTGIFADPPENTQFRRPAFLIPYSYYELTQSWVGRVKDRWDNNVAQVYLELEPGTGVEDVNANIDDLISKNHKDLGNVSLFLHPMNNWRLNGTFVNGKESGGMITYVRLFSGIAIFILAIACINFMNLATARSERRAREVGIRKTIGSRRKDLIFQFLGESVLLAMFAFLVSIVMVELSLPLYNQLIGKKLMMDYTSPNFWMIGMGLTILTGLLAGSYPAFYLSSFQPVQVLKGKPNIHRGSVAPREVLVTLQFAFSIFLIVAAIVVHKQIQHMRVRDVGYERENLMLIWTTSDLEKNYDPLKQELISSGFVDATCTSNSPITSIFSTNTLDDWPGKLPGQKIEFTTIATGYDYTKTMGIRLLQGRDFSPEHRRDSFAMVINQATVDVLNLQNPIGEKVKMWEKEWEIIGVTENILMDSPYKPVEPMVMIMDPNWISTINVRLSKGPDLNKAIASVEAIFKKHNPAYPFEYRFADDSFEQKFASFNMTGMLSNVFAFLAMIITAMGLFGLASFATEQRSKEISIRKVMGATVTSLTLLITKDFSKLVLIAFVIVSPLGWWAMNLFLEKYPYRIDMPLWVIPFAGILTFLLTLTIVSLKAIKSAIANPSHTLRSE